LNKKIEILHEKAIDICKQFNQAQVELIEILQAVEQKRVYLHFGCSSLFDYSVKKLGLGKSKAQKSSYL